MRLWGHVRDGIIALAPIHVALGIGAFVGILAFPLALPLWFFGRCVFADHVTYRVLNPEAPVVACSPVPSLAWWQWGLALLLPAAIGIAGSWLHRWSLRRRFELQCLRLTLWPADLSAALAGVFLMHLWARHVPPNWLWTFDFPAFVRYVSPVAAILWWRAVSAAAAAVYAHLSAEDPVIATTVHILLARRFRVRRLLDLDVQCVGERLTVRGPFDAVDAGRVEDVLRTQYPVPFQVRLETTLSEEAYWRPYREELKPSGYRSKPIRQAQVPAVLVYGLVLVGTVLIGVALVRGPGIGLRPDDLGAVVRATTEGQSWYEEWLASRGLSPTSHEPFTIDVDGSSATCPHFAVDATSRYRLARELRIVRSAAEPAVRIHQVGETYYLFFIDRGAKICVKEFAFPSIQAAQGGARQYGGPAAWEHIPPTYAWHHVPPLPR